MTTKVPVLRSCCSTPGSPTAGCGTPSRPALAHTFRVIRPDLRGFGETPMPPGAYADADDVDALLDSLGVTDAAVVGSSFGGRVAMELATLHPARVSSLVLLCAAYRGLEPTESVQRVRRGGGPAARGR